MASVHRSHGPLDRAIGFLSYERTVNGASWRMGAGASDETGRASVAANLDLLDAEELVTALLLLDQLARRAALRRRLEGQAEGCRTPS
jgi:hypothetical protein